MKKLTIQEIEKRIKCRFPEEKFTILHYESLGKPGSIKCDTCGKEIKISKFSNFFASTKAYGCVNCHGLWKNREKKIEQILQLYNIIDTYVKNTHTYYHVQCKKCGHERVSTLKNLYKHLQCGCKTQVYRGRTADEFIKEVNKNAFLGEYKLIGEYKNQSTPVLLQHSCGFVWKVRPGDVIHGRSQCPKCRRKESKMETFIKNLLLKLKIPFQQEKRVGDTLMRFDFYIELKDQKIAIEYNGKQHYEPIDFFGGQKKFVQYQERDFRKKQYCIDNNIDLLVLHYSLTEEEISNKIINKFNDYLEREQTSSEVETVSS